MNAGTEIADARRRAGLTQVALARRSGTSQATISAYENGAKAPSLATLQRLLGASGAKLVVAEADGLDRATQREISDELIAVLDLASQLPVRHKSQLTYPRLPGSST